MTTIKLLCTDGEYEADIANLQRNFGFFELFDELGTTDGTVDMKVLPITRSALQDIIHLSECDDIDANEMPQFIQEGRWQKVLEAYNCLDANQKVTKYIEDGHLYNKMMLFKACPAMYKATVLESQSLRFIATNEHSLFHGLVEIDEQICESITFTTLPKLPKLPKQQQHMLFHQWEQREDQQPIFQACEPVFNIGEPADIIMDILKLGNVVVAGGYALETVRAKRSFASDVDVYIYGLNEKDANAKMQEIANVVNCTGFCTGNAYTFPHTEMDISLQVILRLYRTPTEVLHGFDIQSCKVLMAVTGGVLKYYGTPTFIESMRYNCVWVDTERQSQTYALRLMKYYTKGFSVLVAGLDRRDLDCEIMCEPISQLKGLALLMRMERELRCIRKDGTPLTRRMLIGELKRLVRRMKLIESDYEHAITFHVQVSHMLMNAWKHSKVALQHLGWFKLTRTKLKAPVKWRTCDPGSQAVISSIGSFHPEDVKYYHQAYGISTIAELMTFHAFV